LKGYWQLLLTEKAKQVSASGTYTERTVPVLSHAFWHEECPATFQKLINSLTSDLEGCEGYINDVVIYGNTWQQHVQRLQALLERLAQARLTVNLPNSEFKLCF